MTDYTGLFEPTNEEKQLGNATGEFVTGAPAMGTADQNAAIIAANKTAGVWDGDDPQDGTDSNDEIEDANMLPGLFEGEVSSDAVNGVVVALPPNQVLVSDADTIAVRDAGDAAPPYTSASVAVTDGAAVASLPATASIVKNNDDLVVVDAADAPVAGSPGNVTVVAGAVTNVKLTV